MTVTPPAPRRILGSNPTRKRPNRSGSCELHLCQRWHRDIHPLQLADRMATTLQSRWTQPDCTLAFTSADSRRLSPCSRNPRCPGPECIGAVGGPIQLRSDRVPPGDLAAIQPCPIAKVRMHAADQHWSRQSSCQACTSVVFRPFELRKSRRDPRKPMPFGRSGIAAHPAPA